MKIIKYDPNSYNTALDEIVVALRDGDNIVMVQVDHYAKYREAQAQGNIVR